MLPLATVNVILFAAPVPAAVDVLLVLYPLNVHPLNVVAVGVVTVIVVAPL